MLAPALADDTRAALDDAAALLESLGHHVEPATLHVNYARAAETFTLWATIAEEMVLARALTGRTPKRGEFEAATWAMAVIGRRLARTRLPDVLEWQRQLTVQVAGLVSRYDAILCASLAYAGEDRRIAADAVRSGADEGARRAAGEAAAEGNAREVVGKGVHVGRLHRAVQPDRPAGDVGAALLNARGLPIGVQFAARHADDALLLQLARQLEQARPWFERRPPLMQAQR